MRELVYHIKRAEVYCYINKLRHFNKPETAFDYLLRAKYKSCFRTAWAQLKALS